MTDANGVHHLTIDRGHGLIWDDALIYGYEEGAGQNRILLGKIQCKFSTEKTRYDLTLKEDLHTMHTSPCATVMAPHQKSHFPIQNGDGEVVASLQTVAASYANDINTEKHRNSFRK